jgi:transcriptional regulator with XRE-family HTH domain
VSLQKALYFGEEVGLHAHDGTGYGMCPPGVKDISQVISQRLYGMSHLMGVGHTINEIRKRMEELGLNAKQTSLKAGLGETYVRDILEGRSQNPRIEHLARVAKVLKCSVDDLRDPADNETPSHERTADNMAELQLNALTAAVLALNRIARLIEERLPPSEGVPSERDGDRHGKDHPQKPSRKG